MKEHSAVKNDENSALATKKNPKPSLALYPRVLRIVTWSSVALLLLQSFNLLSKFKVFILTFMAIFGVAMALIQVNSVSWGGNM